MCVVCTCVLWYAHVCACAWCIHVRGIYMCVHAVQVKSLCLSCGGRRSTLCVYVLCCSHLGTYLGQKSYLFVLPTLLPGVAMRIKKLTSEKISCVLLTQVTMLNAHLQSHRARSKYKLLPLSLDGCPANSLLVPLHSLTKRKRKPH